MSLDRRYIDVGLCLVGIACAVYGSYLLSPASALVVFGLLLVTLIVAARIGVRE